MNTPASIIQREDFFFFLQEWFREYENTFWGDSTTMHHFHLCRRNLGSFKWDSHHWKRDSLSLLYTLSIPFFSGLCKHKKVPNQFLVTQFSTLVRSCWWDDQGKKPINVNVTACWHSIDFTFMSYQTHKEKFNSTGMFGRTANTIRKEQRKTPSNSRKNFTASQQACSHSHADTWYVDRERQAEKEQRVW